MKTVITNATILGFERNHSTEQNSYLILCEIQKWLRETYNLHVEVWYNFETNTWEASLFGLSKENGNLNEDIILGDTYEEALEEGLEASIDLINKKET